MRAAGLYPSICASSVALRGRSLRGKVLHEMSVTETLLTSVRRPRQGPVRVAVVGLGYWGPNLVRNLHELSEVAEVVAVCDARQQRLELIQRRYPAVSGTESYADILGDPTIEAVALATPVATHHPLARAALRAGKHVFIEKPLAASTEEAAELIDLADERGLVLMPG